MAESLDSLINLVTCSVCIEPYKDPRILPCGHSFCLPCIRQYAETKGSVQCPECRLKVQVKPHNVESIKKNFGLSAISEQLAGKGEAQPICEEHKVILSVYCNSCNAVICSECCNTHEGHVIGSINKEFEKVQPLVTKTADDIKVEEQKLTSVIENQDAYLKKLDASQEDILKAVETTVDGLQAELNRCKSAIKQIIIDRMQNLRQPTLRQKQNVQESRCKLLNQIDICNKLLSKTKAHVLKEYKDTLRSAEECVTSVPLLPSNDTWKVNIPSGEINCSWTEDAIKHLQFCWKDTDVGEWDRYQRQNTSVLDLIKKIEEDNTRMKNEKETLASQLQTSQRRCSEKDNECDGIRTETQKLESQLQDSQRDYRKKNGEYNQ